MTPQEILSDCQRSGIFVQLVDGKLKAKGADDALRRCTPILKSNKTQLVDYLRQFAGNPFVREFMEVDGMTLQEAREMAAVSVPLRPATEWLALIAELDALIVRYGDLVRIPGNAVEQIKAARNVQPLASIPESLAWFRGEVEKLESDSTCAGQTEPVRYRNYLGRVAASSARLLSNKR